MIHAAKLERSERLQRIYRLLKQRGPRGATTREIDRECDTVCAGSGVAELRANGKRIEKVRERETETGRVVFRYILLETHQDAISCPVCEWLKVRNNKCANPACGCPGKMERRGQLDLL